MSAVRVLARNILSSWAGLAVHIVVSLLLVPLILTELGEARYGMWFVISNLTGYYGLLDLGFRAGLTQYLARYLSERDFTRLSETASTGLAVLATVGIAILVPATLIAAFILPYVFTGIPNEIVGESRAALVIVGASLALNFVFFLASSVLNATQRLDISSAIGVPTRVLYGLLTFGAVRLEFGLVGLAGAIFLTNLVDYTLRWVAARRVLPEMRLSIRYISRDRFREFMTFGLWNFLIATSRQLISYTDNLIILWLMSPAAVARYSLAALLSNLFGRMLTPASIVFFPELTRLDAQNDDSAKRSTVLQGSRFLVATSLAAALVFFLAAPNFYKLWLGTLQRGGEFPPAHLIFRILLFAQLVTFCQGVSRQLLLGSRNIRPLAIIFACEAVINLVLSVILIQQFGLVGVAVATVVGSVVFQAVVLPIYVLRLCKIALRDYALIVWLRPLLVLAVVAPVTARLLPHLQTSSHVTFVAFNLLLGIFIAGAFTLGVTSRVEQKRFIVRPLLRLFRVRRDSS